jgi:hypothetical protein
MHQLGLTFHHFGLAVRSPDAARRFLGALGYCDGDFIFDPEQNVNLMLCTHDSMPDVEVICPASAGKSPVDRLVARHANGIVYHLCYVASDLQASLAAMEQAGLNPFCIAPPKPAILFAGEQVSFYMIDGLGLVEILEFPGQPKGRP